MKENTKIYLLLLIIFILCVIGELSAQSIKSVKTHLNASQIQHKEIVKQMSNDTNADVDSHLTVFILSIFLVRFSLDSNKTRRACCPRTLLEMECK